MSNFVFLFCFWSFCCCFVVGSFIFFGLEGQLEDEFYKFKVIQIEVKFFVRFNFCIFKDLEYEGCYFFFSYSQFLEDCGFNMIVKIFFIIYGWMMSGIFENWLYKFVLVLYIREKDVNVVVVDWFFLVYQFYMDVVNNIRVVGYSIVRMFDWLQEKDDFFFGNVYLIGYSFGVYVVGYVGNFVKGMVG